MSLQSELNQLFDNYIGAFIEKVSDSYNIPKDKLWELWGQKTVESKAKSAPRPRVAAKKPEAVGGDDEEPSDDCENLEKKSVTELKNMCRVKGLKTSGNKTELIGRINNPDAIDSMSKKPEPKKKVPEGDEKKAEPEKKAVAKKAVAKKEIPQAKVLDNLEKKSGTLQVRKNKHGNFEHTDTHLVIDTKSKKVIGKQLESGEVSELCKNDIDICKKMNLLFDLPTNLDNGNGEDDEEDDSSTSEDQSHKEEVLNADDIGSTHEEDDSDNEFDEEED